MKTIRNACLALGAGTLLITPAFSQQNSVRYRAVVDLTGTITARNFPVDPAKSGPNDPVQKRYFLNLDKPIAVTDGNNGDKTMSPDEKNISALEMMSGAAPPKAVAILNALDESVAKHLTVTVTGSLFHSSTREHHTPVLVEIVDMKAVAPPPPPPAEPASPPPPTEPASPPPPPPVPPAVAVAAPVLGPAPMVGP